MDFYCYSTDTPAAYKEFILQHDNAVKTEKAEWMKAHKAGKKVWPYSQSMPEEAPNRESIIYFEFVDEDLNIYVDFFNRDTEEFLESYRFKDDELAWTISVDNVVCGDPLGLMEKKKAEGGARYECDGQMR